MTDGAATYNLFPPGWSTTPLATYVYSYDSANRVTTQVDSDGTYTYTYDNANELTGVDKNGTQVESYSYDLNGNRNSTGYTTTTGNELTAAPGYTYTYDNAGNMTSSTNTSTHVTATYTYDYRNRLTEVTTGGTVVATYTYDALNRRIGTDDNGTQTWTVYDGMSPDANPYADFNGSGSLTVRYLFGPTVVSGAVTTGVLARTSSGGTTAWYLTDDLGSVRDIVSASGNELDHIVYDSFGNVVTETNATNGDRFKFAGMQYDATIGQYFDHARWYGAGAGRFMSLDPTTFSAGDSNLYRYVQNDVTRLADPTGLQGQGPGQQVGDVIQELASNGPFMTALNQDTGLGPIIARKLQDPNLPTMIKFGPLPGTHGESNPVTGIITLNENMKDAKINIALTLVHELAHLAYRDFIGGVVAPSKFEEVFVNWYELQFYIIVIRPALQIQSLEDLITKGAQDWKKIVDYVNRDYKRLPAVTKFPRFPELEPRPS
jgi:RHS repeat-associated protein